jgi:tetratricopeptide (TPR) repeat protein
MMVNPFKGPSFLRTFGLVLLAIALLFTADTFLANAERAESRAAAARLFQQSQALMQQGDNAQAIERIQDAIANERGNRDYLRLLAQAQFAAGKTSDAESTLTELLQSNPTDGLASLIMGRVLVKEGRFTEATSYLHRAIYGDWKEDAVGNQLRARFELIDLLAERNSKEELLAELIAVQDRIPTDLERKRGRLFLLAGSPARAAEVFRGILQDAPEDADAHAGLGEAEFARGNYREAEREFQAALRLAPDHRAARQRVDLCNEVLTLDPTMRGLGPAERLRRSRKLVELTVDEATQCTGQNAPPELQGLLDEAGKALKAHVSPVQQSEASESDLDLAEKLWQGRKQECKPPPSTDGALGLVMARLAQ